MNVGELRAILDDLPEDMPIIMSKDAEGNGFSPLAAVAQGFYEATTTWYGEFVRSTPYPLQEGVALVICLDPVN